MKIHCISNETLKTEIKHTVYNGIRNAKYLMGKCNKKMCRTLLRQIKDLNREMYHVYGSEDLILFLTPEKANPSNFQPLHILMLSWRFTKYINIFMVCEVS